MPGTFGRRSGFYLRGVWLGKEVDYTLEYKNGGEEAALLAWKKEKGN